MALRHLPPGLLGCGFPGAVREVWRTDVYQLGCILYEMIAGFPPVRGEDTLAVMYSILNEFPPRIGGIPRELEDIMFKALSKGGGG